jgi:hypothetical protein
MNAVGVFLVFGACMAALAGTTLVWQGTALDRLWVLNKSAYMQLAPIGRLVGTLFLVLSTIFVALQWAGSNATFGDGDWLLESFPRRWQETS